MNLRYSIDQNNSAWRVVDGEAVLINAETTFYYGLNPSATHIWKLLLEDDLTAREIAERVTLESGIEPTEIMQSVAGFLDELTAEKLLTTAEAATSGRTVEQAPKDPAGSSKRPYEWETPLITRYDTLEELIVCGE